MISGERKGRALQQWQEMGVAKVAIAGPVTVVTFIHEGGFYKLRYFALKVPIDHGNMESFRPSTSFVVRGPQEEHRLWIFNLK